MRSSRPARMTFGSFGGSLRILARTPPPKPGLGGPCEDQECDDRDGDEHLVRVQEDQTCDEEHDRPTYEQRSTTPCFLLSRIGRVVLAELAGAHFGLKLSKDQIRVTGLARHLAHARSLR